MMVRWLEGLAGRLWYAGMLCAACMLAMAVGYAVVRGLASEPRALSASEAASMDDARRFRDYADKLTGLTAAYTERYGLDHGDARGSFAAWVSREFLPGMNQLKRQLLADSTPGAPLAPLLRAADAASAMAAAPSDAAARKQATDLMFEAREAVEAFITETGLPAALAAP
jgi:hypothetical protein